jgi:hypothetical protein
MKAVTGVNPVTSIGLAFATRRPAFAVSSTLAAIAAQFAANAWRLKA